MSTLGSPDETHRAIVTTRLDIANDISIAHPSLIYSCVKSNSAYQPLKPLITMKDVRNGEMVTIEHWYSAMVTL